MQSSLKVDSKRTLNACLAIIRGFGIWPLQFNSSPLLNLLNAIWGKIILTCMWIFALTLFAHLCLSFSDLKIVIDDGCFLAGITMILAKNFNYHLRQVKIQNLINAVHDPVEFICKSSDPSVLDITNTVVQWESRAFYVLTSFSSILTVAMTFITLTDEGLPMRAKFPFDTSVQPMHSVAFIIQGIVIASGIFTVFAEDAIVIGFCRYIPLQLQILGANYEHCQSFASPRCALKDESDEVYWDKHDNEDNAIRSFVPFGPDEVNVVDDSFMKRFKTCVSHHQRIIRTVEDMNELFSSSLFVQLGASFSMICLAGFQALMGADDFTDLIQFVAYLGTAFSQLLCWCYFGNKLVQESDSLAESQWASGWENESDFQSAACYVIVSLIRTRKPLQLSAGEIFTMSMETFIMVLRGAYSFLALLTTISTD